MTSAPERRRSLGMHWLALECHHRNFNALSDIGALAAVDDSLNRLCHAVLPPARHIRRDDQHAALGLFENHPQPVVAPLPVGEFPTVFGWRD